MRLGMLALGLALAVGSAKPSDKAEPMLLIVMDPLAKELACACVKGYGQRDYRKLAARLESALKQRLSVEFSDDLAETLAVAGGQGREVIVIGDQSLVTYGAAAAELKAHRICHLSGQDGSTTLPGVFVVRSDDSAKELGDLRGRTVFFGVTEADARYAAGQEILRTAKLEPAVKVEKRASYSEAALDALDSPSTPPPAALIPAYALPLLEGCHTIKPGDLRVIGKTEPLPFITVVLADQIPAAKEQIILKTLLGIKGEAKLLKALETRDGFKPLADQKPKTPQSNAAWPDWRGLNRDGHAAGLPARLPDRPKFIWKKAAMPESLAGLSVSGERLIVAERDFGDEYDVYRCLNANDGELLWRAEFLARGKLDYGQAPRATPVIHESQAYLLGAFGDLRCVNLSNGKVIWERQLPREFQAELPTWGMCSTPLLVEDLLIVNPGGSNASLVALDRRTGRTRWTTPGLPAAYAAFISGNFGGRRQIVGYDQQSLGGWDAKTGRRLWQLVPPVGGDFNVPTPIAVDGGLIVSTENNGTRLYHFDDSARIIPKPAAEFANLSPDTSTPVVTCGRVFGMRAGLHCLDVKKGLKPIWHREDESLSDYVTLIADEERVLLITLAGELILLNGSADECSIISRLRVFDEEVEMYSHPALVGQRLYLRGGPYVACLDLAAN
jgi:outer membrane protein assembly factor BamB/ABC-type phosphate/phosphonate transport system substrate-binding protein